jgi:hypothetical protein
MWSKSEAYESSWPPYTCEDELCFRFVRFVDFLEF